MTLPTLYHREIRGRFILLGRGDQGSIVELADGIVQDLHRQLNVDAYVLLFRRDGAFPIWDQLLTAGGRFVGVAEGAPSLDATVALFDAASPTEQLARQTRRIRQALIALDPDPKLAWEVSAPSGSGLARMQGWLVRIGKAPRYVIVPVWPSGGFIVAPELNVRTPQDLTDCLAALPALESDPTALMH